MKTRRSGRLLTSTLLLALGVQTMAVQSPAGAVPATSTTAGAPSGVEPGQEIIERRTAVSKTFATETPGRFKTQVFSQPVHFRGKTGKWDAIDTDLVDKGSGRVGPKGSPVDIDLSDQATDPALARLSFDADHSVSFSLDGARTSTTSKQKGTITHRGIQPGVDLELSLRPAGLKEDLVLASPAMADTFVFPLVLRGLTASVDDTTGDVVYTDEAGVERSRTPHGFMEDSAADPRTGGGAESMGVSYELVPFRGDRVALKVRLDRAWLDDAARVYPVRVDPSYWNSTTLQDDTYVMSGFTRDNAYDAELKVGTYDGGAHVGRSYMNFDVSGLAGKVINSATFSAYETWSWSCTARGFGLYRVTQAWGGHSMTGWPGATYGEQVAWSSSTKGYGSGCPAGWTSFNVTNTVQNWTSGFTGQFGLMMKADSEADNLAWKTFASWDASGGGSTTPHIDIYWSEPSVNRDPFGSIDDASGQAGRVYLRGWGIDPEVVSSVNVHVYIDGAFADGFTANAYRPDVGAAYPGYGNYHGYDRLISAATGWRNVCIYLINVPSGNNPQLGCRWAYVSPPTPPSTPTSVAATANPNGSATISWVRSTSDGGAAIDSYAINTFYSSNGAYTGQQNIVCGSCATTTFSSLSGGTGYYFAVYPHNVAGYGTPGWSNTITTTSLPGSPTTASASANLDSSVSVNWSLVSNNGGTAIDSYAVNAYYASNGSYAGRQNLVCATCASTVFTGLQQDSAYYFGVFAHNAVGYGSPKWTNTVTVATFVDITGPPTNVIATRGDTVASVSWTAPVLAVPPLTTYILRTYRASDAVNVSSTSAGTSTSTTVAGLKNGTAYYFKVIATNIGASPESASSNTITPAGVPFQPTAVTAVPGDSKATVSWSPPAARPDGTPGDNGATITGYTVTASPGGATAASATTQATVGGLVNGTTYTFTVRSTNTIGSSTESLPSGGAVVAAPPSSPANVSATAGDRTANVLWTSSSPNGSAVTSYRVTSSPGGVTKTVGGAVFNTTMSLLAGTTYTFTVVAVNSVGSSVPSDPSNAVTVMGPPSAPTSVSAVAGTGQATVMWNSSNPNGSPVTAYTVSASSGTATAMVGGQATSAAVTGLSPGTSYTFTVVATNNYGEGTPSVPSNAVTPSQEPGVVETGPVPASAQQVDAFKSAIASQGVVPGQYSEDELRALLVHGGLVTWLLGNYILPAVETFQSPCTGPNGIGTVPCERVTRFGYDYGPIFNEWANTEVAPAIIITAAALEFWIARNYLDVDDPGVVEAKTEAMSVRSQVYQQQRTGLPPNTVYRVNTVAFDGYRSGTLIEAKGEGYAWAVQNGAFRAGYRGADDMVLQAQRQLAAAGSYPIQWEVAEESVAIAIQNLFVNFNIQGITVVHVPPAP